MTATLDRPVPPGESRPPHRTGSADSGWYPVGDDSRRTAMVGLGAVLAFAPLFVIFTDWTWLLEGIGAALCVLGPAIALRYRSVPRSWQLLPGLLLLAIYCTALYLSRSAVAGLLPGPDSWNQVLTLRQEASAQIQDNVTPLNSTHALRSFIVPGLGLFTALVDWYAVVRRAPALAGVPLLALFTVCGAVAGETVGWIPFASAAIGFLVILSADSRVSLLSWGRVVPRRQGDRPVRARLGLSGRRIGVAAVLVAVAVPVIIPGLSRNLLTDSFHGNGSGSGQGNGTSISPFATLKGQLTLGQVVNLAQVTVTPGADPYFLRSKVLDNFTGSGWVAAKSARGSAVTAANLSDGLPVGATNVSYTATVRISGLTDTAPILGSPKDFDGLRSAWRLNSADDTLVNSKTNRNETYTESVLAAAPTTDELAASGRPLGISSSLTTLPSSFPASVRSLVTRLTDKATTPYARAIAMYSYFKDPANHFVYNLSTKAGDSGSDLVDFLTNRTGYCQQYAGALGVMFRAAGIPARVVLGYTHVAPDKNGQFTITSHDAHAWVEGYFQGIGWLPFNPTPLVGADSARDVPLPYATVPGTGPTAAPTASTSSTASASAVGRRTATDEGTARAQTATATATVSSPLLPGWFLPAAAGAVLALLLLSVLPGLRVAGRRSRFRAALNNGRLEPLWQELRASAVDSGTAWSTSTTPRQVPAWLQAYGVGAQNAVERLANGVEMERYARGEYHRADADSEVTAGSAAKISDAIQLVQSTSRAMRSTMDRRHRLLSALAPASLTGRWRRNRSHDSD